MGSGERVFRYAIRLLSQEQRAALGAIREFVAELERSAPGDPAPAALGLAQRRFGLPSEALGDLIEGVRADVPGLTHEGSAELLLHCRRTGGSLARLGVAVLGSSDRARADELASDVGVALRLTQIVRDLRPDAERGRVYLPAEDFERYHLLGADRPRMTPEALAALARAGIVAEPAALSGLDGGEQAQLYALMRFQVLRAGDWLHRGAPLPTLLDRRGGACVLTATGFYRGLLDRIEQRPDRALAGRIALPAGRQALVAARGLLGRRQRERHPAEHMPLD